MQLLIQLQALHKYLLQQPMFAPGCDSKAEI